MAKKPIIIDRSRLEQYANCPRQAYLTMLWEALKAKAEKKEVFFWEADRIKNADPALVSAMTKSIERSVDSKLADIGTEIHSLIEQAFAACNGDTSIIPEWFVDNLPKIKPNIQPMAIKHARHVGDIIADFHIPIIGIERQLHIVAVPETETTPAVILTMRYDLVGSGKNCLHGMDWKTGFKRRSNTEAADSLQAQFGAWLLWQQAEYKDVNTIHWWYFETMWGTKAYARFDRNEEHPRLPGLTTETAIKGRIMEALKLFMENNTEAWPLPEQCCWCDMIEFCPHASMSAKTIADNPKGFVDSLVVLEELCKIRKKVATEWIKAKGEIEGTKVVFTKSVPKERFTACFEDKGVKNLAASGDDDLDSHFGK